MRKLCLTLLLGFVITSPKLYSQTITPVVDASGCQFAVGNTAFSVIVDGGRVSSYKIDDKEFLFTDENYGGGNLWGAVLWSSPQSEWNWPPITTLDSKPYTIEAQGNRCRMISDIDSKMKMRFIKDFYAASEDTSITVVYKMINEGTTTKHNALWELTRVPTTGFFFFPTGEGSATSGLATYVQEKNGYSWYNNQLTDVGGQKFFADGKMGWDAFINEDHYILIKQFVDVPNDKHAPGENEIELWLTSDYAYMELENQSSYESIPAGDTIKYIVKWYLRKLPDTMTVEVGNTALADFVTHTIGNEVTDPDPGTGTAVSENFNAENIALYPNPTKASFSIHDNLNKELRVEVYNLAGQLLQRINTQPDKSIDVSMLDAGLYIIKIQTETSTLTQRLVIK